jgi:protein-S-isoprenylcysteine O-methyltransferase Ste14
MAPTPSVAARVFAWLGGAAFVFSLAYFPYFFLIGVDRLAAPALSPLEATLWNVATFSLFALHHSVLARTRAKQWIQQWIPPSLERSTYVWIASALFFLVCWLWQPISRARVYSVDGELAWVGLLTQGFGLVLTARATGVLGALELAGISQAQSDATPVFRAAGPYRWVRHPVYLGWILFVLGAPQMSADRFAIAAISTAYLLLAIQWEERTLIELFGERYLSYRRQVRWRLLPGIY